MNSSVSVSIGTALRAEVSVSAMPDKGYYITLREAENYDLTMHIPGYGAVAAAHARTLGQSLLEAAEKLILAEAMLQQQVTQAEAAIVATLIGPQEPGRTASPSGDPQS